MLKLNKDAPMADLLNRAMVVVLILSCALPLAYSMIGNSAGLVFGSDADVIKLATQNRSNQFALSSIFLVNALLMLPMFLRKWGRVIQSIVGGITFLFFSLICVRLYMATGQVSSIEDGILFAACFLAALLCVNVISYFRKPQTSKDEGNQSSSLYQKMTMALVLFLAVIWVTEIVQGDANVRILGICAFAFGLQVLLPQFDKHPVLRIAAVTLALAVAIIWLILFTMKGGIAMIVRHWDVALVVGYLPLMGLAWFGYIRWQALKK